jgi:DNA-binding transcriptional regulator YiaG
MKLCDCGGRLESKRLSKHEDKRLGLPGVRITLFNAVTLEKCALCARVESVTVGNLEGLIATVALTRAQHPARLNGGEILFLRKAMEFTAKEMATRLDVNEQTISRWENDADPIGAQSEKLLRLLVGDQLRDRAPLIEFTSEQIWALKIMPMHARPLHFEFTLIEHGPDEQTEERWTKGAIRKTG